MSTNNRLQILEIDKKQDEINLKQPEESRLIIVGDSDGLSKLGISTFLRLFGPIINLE